MGKLWKMQENIKKLNLSQQKGEEIIWCQNPFTIQQSFSTEDLLAIEMKKA